MEKNFFFNVTRIGYCNIVKDGAFCSGASFPSIIWPKEKKFSLSLVRSGARKNCAYSEWSVQISPLHMRFFKHSKIILLENLFYITFNLPTVFYAIVSSVGTARSLQNLLERCYWPDKYYWNIKGKTKKVTGIDLEWCRNTVETLCSVF